MKNLKSIVIILGMFVPIVYATIYSEPHALNIVRVLAVWNLLCALGIAGATKDMAQMRKTWLAEPRTPYTLRVLFSCIDLTELVLLAWAGLFGCLFFYVLGTIASNYVRFHLKPADPADAVVLGISTPESRDAFRRGYNVGREEEV